MQYLAGELAVEAGMVLPLRAAHNTVAMRFDVEVWRQNGTMPSRAWQCRKGCEAPTVAVCSNRPLLPTCVPVSDWRSVYLRCRRRSI